METTLRPSTASQLDLCAQDLLTTTAATDALNAIDRLHSILDSASLLDLQDAGAKFVDRVLRKIVVAIGDTELDASLSSLKVSVDYLASVQPQFRNTSEDRGLREEIESLESFDDFLEKHRRLAGLAAVSDDENAATLLRFKLTSFLADAVGSRLDFGELPAYQVFRDLRMTPPELWDLSLAFIDYDITTSRLRLNFPNLLSDNTGADVINDVAKTVARLGPELPPATRVALAGPLKAIVDIVRLSLARDLAAIERLNFAFSDAGAENSVDFWSSVFFQPT